MNNYIITSFYTKNTGYEQEVEKLIDSLKHLQLSAEIVGINSLGSWDRNTKYKPLLIKNMLEKFPTKSIVYVDADAVVHSNPILFETLNCDFAAHYFQRKPNRPIELLSGTLYLANNERTKRLVDEWIRRSKTDNRWEQKILQDIISQKVIPNLIVQELPPEYCKIFDTMNSVKTPIIEHFQASRRFKSTITR